MNNVVKTILISIGLNLLLAVLLSAPLLFGVFLDNAIVWLLLLAGVGSLSLLIQLFIGVVYLFNPEKKETGQGMLITVGLFMLIGFTMCSGAWV